MSGRHARLRSIPLCDALIPDGAIIPYGQDKLPDHA